MLLASAKFSEPKLPPLLRPSRAFVPSLLANPIEQRFSFSLSEESPKVRSRAARPPDRQGRLADTQANGSECVQIRPISPRSFGRLVSPPLVGRAQAIDAQKGKAIPINVSRSVAQSIVSESPRRVRVFVAVEGEAIAIEGIRSVSDWLLDRSRCLNHHSRSPSYERLSGKKYVESRPSLYVQLGISLPLL